MKTLIYDLETAPTQAYVWRMWKENIAPVQVIDAGHVICWSARWHGTKKTYFGADWLSEDFIHDLHALQDEADAIITYNGNKFDEPVMKTEFAKRGLAPPPPRKSIDLYQVVRREFRLLHNRMDSVAAFLGIEGKTDTGGFKLWADVVDGKPAARKLMKKYNIQDIDVLEEIYEKLLPWIKNHPAIGHYDGDAEACPNCGSSSLHRRGTHKTKVSTFQRYQCQDCGTWSRARVADKFAPKPEIVTI